MRRNLECPSNAPFGRILGTISPSATEKVLRFAKNSPIRRIFNLLRINFAFGEIGSPTGICLLRLAELACVGSPRSLSAGLRLTASSSLRSAFARFKSQDAQMRNGSPTGIVELLNSKRPFHHQKYHHKTLQIPFNVSK